MFLTFTAPPRVHVKPAHAPPPCPPRPSRGRGATWRSDVLCDMGAGALPRGLLPAGRTWTNRGHPDQTPGATAPAPFRVKGQEVPVWTSNFFTITPTAAGKYRSAASPLSLFFFRFGIGNRDTSSLSPPGGRRRNSTSNPPLRWTQMWIRLVRFGRKSWTEGFWFGGAVFNDARKVFSCGVVTAEGRGETRAASFSKWPESSRALTASGGASDLPEI